MNKNLKKVISTVAAIATTASCIPAFAANFSDVADTAEYKTAVDNLVALDIVGGYEDGTFGPEKEITRAEVSKMIVGTMGPSYMNAAESLMGQTSFTDVASDHWASGYIAQGVSSGFINGMGDGTFAPNSNVTYAQVVKMLVSILGYGDDADKAGGYPNGYVSVGAQIGVTKGVSASNNDAVNRGQVAMLIDNALKTPINAIVGWTPTITTDENGNLVTVNVPETEVYDGTGDSKKYENLLTTYFDAYAVRGRIMDTTSKGEGKVSFRIEYADKWDDEYKCKTTTDATGVKYYVDTLDVIFPVGLDVDSYLCSYVDAIIAENEDGDFELVSIAQYGKNDVVEVTGDLFDGIAGGEISFKKSASTSKTNDYTLDANVEYYVNGKAVAEADAKSYIQNGDVAANVMLINTPKDGSKSIDSKYDYVMVSVYAWALVDSTDVTASTAKIYFKDSDANILPGASELKIDLDAVANGDQEYEVVDAEGNEVALEDITENDVLSIYADFEATKPLNAPDFVKVIVTSAVVEGKVTGASQDDSNQWEYTIGGETYSFANSDKNSANANLTTGNEYTLVVDAFGRIVDFDELATSVNYAVINRVAENSSTGNQEARIVTADGKVVTYEFKRENEFTTWKAAYEALAVTAATKKDKFDEVMSDMVVTYKLDSSNRIYDLAKVTLSLTTKEEFSERNLKISSAKMSDATKVLDFTGIKSTTVTGGKVWSSSIASEVKGASVASFADGEEYIVAYGGNKFSDGTYPLVIVLEGQASISKTTSFAVVDSVGSGSKDDGISYKTINVYTADSSELVTLYREDSTKTVKKGDIIVYALNNDGLVEDADLIVLPKVAASEEYGIKLSEAAGFDYTATTTDVKADRVVYLDNTDMPVPSWKASTATDEDYARFGFGVIVDKADAYLTVGKVEKDGGKYVTKTYTDIDFANDVNVYVYDYNNTSKERVYKSTKSVLGATKLASTFVDDTGVDPIYKWEAAGKKSAKFVYFKTVEDEITDIMVVIPHDDADTKLSTF